MRRRLPTYSGTLLIAAAGLLCLFAGEARAQQSGHNILGDVGLHSGTQAPPGIYVGNLYYTYPTSKLAGDDGDKVNRDGRVRTTIDAVFVNWVTTRKFLGANIGGQVAVPIIKNRIEAFSIDAATDLGLSDVYVQPINLGWHFKRADVIASYGVFMPTGDYKAGNADNTGLGMFSHELALGSTVYLTENKMWHAAALFQYEMHARKPGIDVKVGDLVSIEGGVGKTFVKMIPEKGPLVTNIGVAAYAQFKATADSGLGINPLLLGRKDRVFGVGPEFNVYIPHIKSSIGVRYIPEFGARNSTQGQTLVITFAYQARSWAPPHGAPPPPAAAPAGN